MLNPLPTVETACASLEQEEAQRSLLSLSKSTEVMALYSKTQASKGIFVPVTCTACKGRGHSAEKCWTVVGFPKWHSRYSSSPVNKTRTQQQHQASN